ncbi:MAG TPA: valine--tRNA ligase, partial [Bryobacteraceae bacterium]|nr:valine--tRNA ligase [Bryobacteraceae bacterium]
MPTQIDKVYEPQRFEPAWAQWWIEKGIFKASAKNTGRTFSIAIPPPNVTGVLHMGHMLNHAEHDVVVRWRRMLGYNTLWLPGTDHAGIATQMVVERQLAAEGTNRYQLGREAFEKRVWEWKAQSGGTILKQMIRLGTSCDWSRERFTLDPGLSRAVRETFVRLYEKDLIYRGEYMVNWCPSCFTAISDLETVHEETQGRMWHIAYPVVGSDEKLVVATTRPETMLGDTAVVVNPEDGRYRHLHGKTVMLPLMNREIPIVLDSMADPKFGTGVVKVTPAHDLNDFEAGKRHKLPTVKVINEHAKMTAAAGPYAELDRFDARKRIVADLESLGLLVKTEEHRLPLGRCQRCRTPIEPLVSKQWFVKTKPIAEPAIRVVEDGRIQIIPEHWTKTYYEWMYNIRDWCISRQLWWGHRIPAWHCQACHQVTVSREDPTQCAHCGSEKIEQDPDVLDTWFSSGLWPFSTLGWPDKTEDLATFYPTSLLITGFDILFFWVARMIMLGLECTGDVPFRAVYLHSMVRDAEGQKMSKTKGNVIDPLDVTEKYGTDAVRMALLRGASPGTDISIGIDNFESARAFANKIWNASRLIFMKMETSGVEPWAPGAMNCCLPEPITDSLVTPLEDRWIFSRLNRCAESVNRAVENYRFHEAAQTLWHFVWHEFCDWYLELKKLRFEDNTGLNAHWRNLLTVYEMMLRLLHPLMPFLTEELWQRVAEAGADRPISIALANYPQYNPDASDAQAEYEMEILQSIVTAARELRADMKIDPKQMMDGVLVVREPARSMLDGQLAGIERIAGAKLDVRASDEGVDGVKRGFPEFDLIIRVSASQAEAQRSRIQKEIEQLE